MGLSRRGREGKEGRTVGSSVMALLDDSWDCCSESTWLEAVSSVAESLLSWRREHEIWLASLLIENRCDGCYLDEGNLKKENNRKEVKTLL